MTILVTGATGTVGRHVVQQLLDRGAQVRAMTRQPATAGLPAGAEVVQGYLLDPDTLQAPLEGIDRVFLFPFEGETEPVMAHMRTAGVRHVVILSSSAVDDSADEGSDYQLDVERAVERNGFDWTRIRPCGFMANALDWAETIRTHNVVRAPYGRSAHPYIHEADIAAVAVSALTGDGHAGQTYLLTGPEPISQIEQVEAIGRAIGRDIRFEELSPDAAREFWGTEWASSLTPAEIADLADFLLNILAEGVQNPQPPLTTVEEITGRRPIAFEQWAEQNADAFLHGHSRLHHAAST